LKVLCKYLVTLGPCKDGLLFNIIADDDSMAVIYAMVSVGNLANRNKYWQEAVEELSFRIDEKNGLTSNAEFIMSSLLYHSIYFKAWS
jgi:hypothetical protein